MIKPTVYVETTIFSALVARPTKDAKIARRHQTTRAWWQNDADRYKLFTSDAVEVESAGGDPEMASRRLAYIASLPRLLSTDETRVLSQILVDRGFLPGKAKIDALHLSIATLNRLDYLVTWNCRHLANRDIYRQIERYLRGNGYTAPRVCTLDQLRGVEHGQ